MGENALISLSSLVTGCPVVLVQVTALIVAIARFSKHPKVSMMVATASGMGLVVDLVSRVVFATLPRQLMESEGRSALDVGTVLSIVGAISSLLHAIVLGLLVMAALGERAPSRPQPLA